MRAAHYRVRPLSAPDHRPAQLARTRAEVRVLSHLMRVRRFARQNVDDAKRFTVKVSRGAEDDRTASPLEIAIGDRLRIGATHWEKQLFNGTVVTVEDLQVLQPEAGTRAEVEGREPSDARERAVGEPPVLISARTDDGREVRFRHDEIRDWYGNVRLDHGYALIGEWNALIDRARQSGAIAFYMKGYSELIPRIRELTENPDIPADRRESLVPLLENHARQVAARKQVEVLLDATGRHGNRRNALEESADERGVTITQTPDYAQWRKTADRLLQEGKAILADRIYGPHLDRVSSVRRLAEDRVSGLGEAIREDDEELAEARREAGERQRLSRQLARLRFATDAGESVQPDAAPAAANESTRANKLLWRFRRIHDWDGRLAESERQSTVTLGEAKSLDSASHASSAECGEWNSRGCVITRTNSPMQNTGIAQREGASASATTRA